MKYCVITLIIIATIIFAWHCARQAEVAGRHIEAQQEYIAVLEAAEGKIYKVTAYCPCKKCCGRFADGITASGEPAEGPLVAAPKDIPFGTKLLIPEYNDGHPVEVLDRGGVIKGDRLDVLFPTHEEALEWGVRHLEVRTVK